MDDIEIVKSVQAGDSESFALLVTKYHKQLLNFIYRLVIDKSIVEDIGQEVFLNVYKSIRHFDIDRGVPFSAWLFIAARNHCISELRNKHSRNKVEVEEAFLLPAPQNPELSFREKENFLAIHAAIEQLAEPFQSTILQSLEGDSMEEISLKEGVSAGTVKSRLFRAREKMKILLQEYF